MFVFLALNLLLLADRCTMNELMVQCNSGRSHTVPVLIVTVALLALALLSRRGRSFATGFFGALVLLSVVTTGACTPSWGDPASTISAKLRPYRERRAAERKHQAARDAWVKAMDARPMDVSRGIELAGAVVACARGFAAARGGRVALSEEELAASCWQVRDFRESLDPGPPIRYGVPAARGVVTTGMSPQQAQGDPGWRVRYEAVPPDNFVVRVLPDSGLTHKAPVITADTFGTFDVQPAGSAPAISVSAVGDLRQLVACLQGIPQEEERRRVERILPLRNWHVIEMARRLCPDLAPRLKPLVQAEADAMLLTVNLPADGPGPVPMAVYRIEFLSRPPADGPFAFDLRAVATTPGLPRYFATSEGSIHTTSEPRHATTGDPLAR